MAARFSIATLALAATLAAAAALGTARADNINPPDYAYGPCSTHMEWTPTSFLFTTSGPLSPYTAMPPHAPCPYPLATPTTTPSGPPPTPIPFAGGMSFLIPNFIDELPIKLMRIQVTLEDLGPSDVIVTASDNGQPATAICVFGCPPPGDLYYYEDWELFPNPDWERVDIFAPNNQILQVVIDTITTPEPGTLAVLGLGLAGLGMMVRRRRRA